MMIKILIRTIYTISCYVSAVLCVRLAVDISDDDYVTIAIGGAMLSWILLTYAFYKSGGFKLEDDHDN